MQPITFPSFAVRSVSSPFPFPKTTQSLPYKTTLTFGFSHVLYSSLLCEFSFSPPVSLCETAFYVKLPDIRETLFPLNAFALHLSLHIALPSAPYATSVQGIVNVFSGMDDYYTSMRLRQFAMMGVPGSIKQAAKVTLDRLKEATDAKRVPAALVSEDLKSLENDAIKNAELDTEAKYDTFVRDYLFPVPTDTPDAATSTWEQTYEIFPGTEAKPERPKRRKEAIIQSTSGNASFAQRLQKYNQDHTSDIMGQNDMTTLVAIGNETFGDRQQLFLYVLRADAIAYNSGRVLSQHKPLSTARAVVLLWRDAYGELPDRIIYQQFLP